eukprot:scaffold19730_cov121-Isochrysis_galbana.AAC.4
MRSPPRPRATARRCRTRAARRTPARSLPRGTCHCPPRRPRPEPAGPARTAQTRSRGRPECGRGGRHGWRAGSPHRARRMRVCRSERRACAAHGTTCPHTAPRSPPRPPSPSPRSPSP